MTSLGRRMNSAMTSQHFDVTYRNNNNSEHHGTLHFHSKHCITIKMPVQYVSGPEFQFHDACVENSCIIIQLVHVTSSGWDKSWNCHLINYIQLVAELVIYRRNIFPLTPQQED
jgi:hypothetical protein